MSPRKAAEAADRSISSSGEKALKRLEEMRRLLTLGTEEEFRAAMRAFGLREDSKQFLDAPHAWREFRP